MTRMLLVGVLVALPGAVALAGRPRPVPCAAGRFDVQGLPLITGGTSPAGDVVTLTPGQVLLDSGCGVTRARIKATRAGTVVRARWRRCPQVTGPLVLAASIEPGTCAALVGRLVAKKAGWSREFRAARRAQTALAPGTFTLIQSRIFAGRGCAVSSCHGDTRAGGLDLRVHAAYDALVGAAAANETARAAGRLRVVPHDAGRSFLADKLRGTLAAGEGAPMPLGKAALLPAEIQLVEAWIDAGAPPSGTIEDQPVLPPERYEPVDPLPVPDPSVGYQIHMQGPVLQPGQEIEGCLWVPAPNDVDIDIEATETALNPGTHHFALWHWDRAGAPVTKVFQSNDIACLSGATLGQGVAGGAGAGGHYYAKNREGFATKLAGGGYIGMNPHYYNEFDVPIRIEVWVNFYRYQGTPEHYAKNFISLDTTFGIDVPPYSQRVRKGRYVNGTGQPLNLMYLAGHMHKRGVRFTAWQSDGTKLFDDFDWAHPSGVGFWPPFVLAPGAWIDYECLHDNGVSRPVYRDAGGTPAPLRFGISAENEMCILTGGYFDD